MKKIASILLSLFMVLTLLPTTALAEGGGHTAHCICGANHVAVGDHTNADNPTWQPITDLTSIDASGTYYLSADVTISSASKWVIGSIAGRDIGNGAIDNKVNVTLCLNGHKITLDNGSDNGGNGCILIENGSLTITDCMGGGQITGVANGRELGIVVACWNSGCALNLYGGAITGINVGGKNGGGVHNEGTFNMYGGTITGNKAGSGGGVYNSANYQGGKAGDATFNFYGGTISGNTATDSISGDVYNNRKNSGNSSTVNANGGTVEGGVDNRGKISASVDTPTTFNGAVTNDGTISGGTFNGAVTNNDTISGGTFNGSVTNDDTISGGTYTGTVTNNGVVKFANENEYAEKKDSMNLTGSGYVQVGSEEGAKKYYTNSGTELQGDPERTILWYGDSISDPYNEDTDMTGCVLDATTNTLTLSNVHLDALAVPSTGTRTIKINGNVTINYLYCYTEESFELSRAVTRAGSSAGSLTIEGNTDRAEDTLYNGHQIYAYGDGDLTIKNLTANLTTLYSAGGLNLENSKVTVGDGNSSGSQIEAKSVTMDDTSILVLNRATIETKESLDNLTNFLPDGYTFAEIEDYGYTIALRNSENVAEPPVLNITLQRHYNVTFDPNGGTWNDGSTAPVTKRIPINTVLADYNEITAPTKDGFTFNKWTNAQNGGSEIEKITGDITLYAQWNSTGGDQTGGDSQTGGNPPSGGQTGGDSQTGGNPPSGDQTGGTSRPHYVKKTDSTDANSAKTFDAGVAVYGVLAVSAVLGMGYVGKKRF